MDLTDLKASNGSGEAVRALVTTLRTPGSTVLIPNSMVNWPGSYIITTGPLLADGTLDPAGVKVFLGHTSGSNIVIDQTAPGYTDGGSSVGDVIVIKPTTWWADSLMSLLLISFDPDGTLQRAAVQEALGITGTTPPDWTTLPQNPSLVTALGNGQYTLKFTGVDLRPTLSIGTKLSTTRSTNAPVQSPLLNGTTNWLNRSATINGMTFTDDFATGAWIKLTNYTAGAPGIITRTNGSNGWSLRLEASGQLSVYGFNGGGGNYSGASTSRAVPLNKWVHVTAQLDMSAFTPTPTTTYIMIDGADVTTTVARNGTNPTTLIQGGNIEIGSYNGGTNLFPGRIAQAFVTSAKLTQTQVRAIYSQGITTADVAAYNIVSAYDLSNSLTDKNATNANNLTAQGSATTTSADSPFGGQADGTISATLDYSVVQMVTYSAGDTTVLVRVAEGCTIPTNSSGVSAVRYSSMDAPYGCPQNIDEMVSSFDVFWGNQQTTTSASIIDFPGATFTVTPPAGSKYIEFQFDDAAFDGAGVIVLRGIVDGVQAMQHNKSSGNMGITMRRKVPIATTGSPQNFKLQWSITTGTASTGANTGTLALTRFGIRFI